MAYRTPKLPAAALVLLGAMMLLPACVEAPPVIEATTALSSTPDTTGPYVVQSVITDLAGDDRVVLRYIIDDAIEFASLRMLEDEDGERFSAGIPGQPAGTAIGYFVTVLRDGERITDDPTGAAARPYRFQIVEP